MQVHCFFIKIQWNNVVLLTGLPCITDWAVLWYRNIVILVSLRYFWVSCLERHLTNLFVSCSEYSYGVSNLYRDTLTSMGTCNYIYFSQNKRRPLFFPVFCVEAIPSDLLSPLISTTPVFHSFNDRVRQPHTNERGCLCWFQPRSHEKEWGHRQAHMLTYPSPCRP